MARDEKRWHFNPYHQRIREAVEQTAHAAVGDTEWPRWAVFRQPQRGEPHVHVGDVHAPDPEMALILAKEQFTRRHRAVNLWIVPVEHIHATPYEDEDVFEHAMDTSYRETRGYRSVRAKARRARGEDDEG